LVERLGAFPLPVEVVAFGHVNTARRIAEAASALGYRDMTPSLRMKGCSRFRTDSKNYIYDCPFGIIANAARLA
jgi:ribose 5-phosphate isomerase A